MLPARFAPALFALILSGMMSFLVSGVATWRGIGLVDGFAGLWMSAWIPSWLVAFPTAMMAGPFARKIVAKLVASG